jgi:hypothetical protein
MTHPTTTGISEHLRKIANDPMWADHAEVRKETLIKAASAIEVLARLLNSYVGADEDTRHDGFDTSTGVDDFPDKDESRKAEAVAILRTLTVQPRAIG